MASSAGDSRITWAVQTLILANIIVFAAQLILDVVFGGVALRVPPGGFPVAYLAFDSAAFVRGFVWQPVTYMFLHGGLMHVTMNMLWLYMFGPEVERVLGSRQFLRFYFICGALGVLVNLTPLVSASIVVGASGAVMGVLVAYAMTNPERQFYFFPFPFPINARGMVVIVIAMDIFSGLSGGTTSVATHFGGMAVGWAYMKFIPMLRTWQNQRDRPGQPKRDPLDEVGEAVNNIFKFDNKRSRRK